MMAHPAVKETDERLIVALDFRSGDEALGLVDRLENRVSFYKVGLGLLGCGGLDVVQELRSRGKHVFLDLKLFDISATVEAAASGLSALGPSLMTVHGDPHVVAAAAAGCAGTDTKVLAVTILTSLDRRDLDECLIRDGEISSLVVERAKRAIDAGADGVVASALEAGLLREEIPDQGFLIVTPGIRLEQGSFHDQKRVASPGAALRAGASHIVVGRPITRAENPVDAARLVLDEMKGV